MNQDLISVIVPVYNVEKFIKQCVEDITNQTYTNLEIILVNDGSTDNSGDICEKMKKEDDRIVVYHKPNGGLSDARNYGIKKSSGKYVTFIDSDDRVSPKLIKHLYDILLENKAQIAICDPIHIYPNKNFDYQNSSFLKMFDVEEALCEMMYQKSFLFSAWGKLYKRNVFDDIEFTKGLLYEDVAIMYKLFAKVNSIVYSNAKLYGYMHRENSITTSKFSIRDCVIMDICDEQLEFAKKYSEKVYNAALTYQTVGALRVFLNAPREKEFLNSINKSINIINNNYKLVIKNKECRKKLVISLILYKLNKKLMSYIYKRIDRWK